MVLHRHHPCIWMAIHLLRRSLTAAEAEVFALGVAAGVWDSVHQRPASLIRGLSASPWHDPQMFAACKMLEENYEMIREEVRR